MLDLFASADAHVLGACFCIDVFLEILTAQTIVAISSTSCIRASGAMYAECVHRYVPENPPVVDPYAASALRSSSRPVSPLVPPGGMRGPAIQTAESSARWAAAALRGSFLPQGRAVPGSAFGAPRGAGIPSLHPHCAHDISSEFRPIRNV